MQYYHSKSLQDRQENKQCEEVEICASEEREKKKDYFLHTHHFYLGPEKITLATDGAHHPNKKSERKK